MRQPRPDSTLHPTSPWPPDDTEESVVGSEYHQHIIDASRDGLRMAARANGASWHVLSQVAISGFRRPDGSPYTMLPDVFIHPQPNPHPGSGEVLTMAELGVPLLVIEVLSASTYGHDLDDKRGKAWSYADAGVAEYLVVDHDCRYMAQHVRALRLASGRWVSWPATAEGRWESPTLGISFEFDGLYLRVRDATGRLKPLPDEADALLIQQTTLLARIRDLAAAGDLAALQALLADRDATP